MRITKFDTSQEDLLVQTLWVQKDEHDPDKAFRFHCPYCAEGIFQIQGNVKRITLGLPPTDDVMVISKGYHCSLRYVVQPILSKKDFTEVTVNRFQMPDKLPNSIFHCVVCRTPLFNFDASPFTIPIMHPMQLPINMVCRKPGCATKYLVKEIV